MRYLTRRLKSFFFWGLCLWLFIWHIDQPEAITIRLKKDAVEIAEEKRKISSGYYNAITRCNDGWVSDSRGPGSCSWHDGVDNHYYHEKSESHRIASKDILVLSHRYYSDLQKSTIINFILIFLFSPFLDLLILRRYSLYGNLDEA